jgi:hypothetical protein
MVICHEESMLSLRRVIIDKMNGAIDAILLVGKNRDYDESKKC